MSRRKGLVDRGGIRAVIYDSYDQKRVPTVHRKKLRTAGNYFAARVVSFDRTTVRTFPSIVLLYPPYIVC